MDRPLNFAMKARLEGGAFHVAFTETYQSSSDDVCAGVEPELLEQVLQPSQHD